MAFMQLNKIDNCIKFAVYGWIRNKEKTLKLRNVPSLITALCILYYGGVEIFDKICDRVEISRDGKTLTAIKNNPGWSWNNYGTIEVPSDQDIICEWKLKILKDGGRNNDIQIGIIAAQDAVRDKLPMFGTYYLFYSGNKKFGFGSFKSYDARFTADDQVTIHLNLKKGELKLIVNGKDGPIAFDNVEQSCDIKYKLIVSLYHEGNALQIIDFTKIELA